jgi:hypothetical protein
MTGPIATMWPVGAALFVAWFLLVGWLAYRRRTAEFALWISFSVFGLLSALLTTLARWQIMVGRGDEHVPPYYSIFALPFHIGLVAIALVAFQDAKGLALRSRARSTILGISTLVIVGELVFGHTVRGIWGIRYGAYAKVSQYAEFHRAARFGTQNWNLVHVIRLSGDAIFVQEYLFKLMPEMKAYGKYKELTAGFVDNPEAFAVTERLPNPVPLKSLVTYSSDPTCFQDGDGAVVGGSDTRMQWHHAFRDTAVPFVRFYGYAHRQSRCDQKVDHVLAVDSRGRILCVSRTGWFMWWELPEDWKKKTMLRRNFTFDFSCPLRGATADASPPYSVLAYIREGHQLMIIPEAAP